MVEDRPFWQSKTFWTNVIIGGASLFPKVQAHLTPTILTGAFVAVNVALRFISNGKVTIS